MSDPGDLSFIRVKGQIEIQLSVERLNVVTTATLCATGMAGVTAGDADSCITSQARFYLTGGEESVSTHPLLSYILN